MTGRDVSAAGGSAASASSGEVLIERDGPLTILTLNRPERSNALSRDLVSRLSHELIEADLDDTVRAVILTGKGNAFCAGADLKEMGQAERAGARYRPWTHRVERSIYEICADLSKPTIAAVNGSAVAGGFELVLACDIVIAHDGVKFGLPEAKIGMGANFGSVVLPRKLPPALALEVLYTGDYVTAAFGERWGLVNKIVDRSAVKSEAIELGHRIARNAPLTVRRMKAVALRTRDLPLNAALRLDTGPNPYFSEDRAEGVLARAEKRDPVWRGR